MPNQTLSKKKRHFYLFLCVIAFFILSPVIALYATGYRFGDKFDLMKTGGMYIVTQSKDFDVFVNGEAQKSSSIFRRNFLIQDIKPNTYDIKVSKEGFMIWEKNVKVYPEKVNELYPFNLPETIDIIPVSKTILTPTTGNSSTTKSKEISNKEFTYAKNLFLATTTNSISLTKNSTSTEEADNSLSHKKPSLKIVSNEIFAEWLGDIDSVPLYFCDLDKCETRISIYKGENVNGAELFLDRSDLVIFSTGSGIYVTEMDGKGGRNIQPVVLGLYDFRIDDEGVLYLKKDDKTFYRVEIKN